VTLPTVQVLLLQVQLTAGPNKIHQVAGNFWVWDSDSSSDSVTVLYMLLIVACGVCGVDVLWASESADAKSPLRPPALINHQIS
jgi:hypothetical protein